jgi:uncharacterized protein
MAGFYKNLLWKNQIVDVRHVDRAILRHAAELRGGYKSLKLPDAIHVSTALRADCTDFLSNDSRLAEVHSYSPSSPDRQPIIKLLRPEAAKLKALLQAIDN